MSGVKITKVDEPICSGEEQRRHMAIRVVLNSRQFHKACVAVGLEPKRRQASKWPRHTGLAWCMGRFADEGGESEKLNGRT